ncbi:MAG: DUF721 domain-containing protein [Kiritimatiellae bacterium]|nr:DUF721 domain-containing protein [Kiritimatiellia bacterium]
MRKPPKFNPGQWEVQRERFQLPETRPPPPDAACPLGEVIPLVLKRLGLDRQVWLTQLENEWPTLVGEPVAAHTQPGRIVGSTLVVFVDSAVWLNELRRYGQREMLRNIQARFGPEKIADLRLQPAP